VPDTGADTDAHTSADADTDAHTSADADTDAHTLVTEVVTA